MTPTEALRKIITIASFTPMQTEIQTAGQMGRIMRIAEEALAAAALPASQPPVQGR